MAIWGTGTLLAASAKSVSQAMFSLSFWGADQQTLFSGVRTRLTTHDLPLALAQSGWNSADRGVLAAADAKRDKKCFNSIHYTSVPHVAPVDTVSDA